jgi:hypothetical protein
MDSKWSTEHRQGGNGASAGRERSLPASRRRLRENRRRVGVHSTEDRKESRKHCNEALYPCSEVARGFGASQFPFRTNRRRLGRESPESRNLAPLDDARASVDWQLSCFNLIGRVSQLRAKEESCAPKIGWTARMFYEQLQEARLDRRDVGRGVPETRGSFRGSIRQIRTERTSLSRRLPKLPATPPEPQNDRPRLDGTARVR